MDKNEARELMLEFDNLDVIWSRLHELTLKMPADDAKRIRRIVASFVVDMYSEVELEIIREHPDLDRDKS